MEFLLPHSYTISYKTEFLVRESTVYMGKVCRRPNGRDRYLASKLLSHFLYLFKKEERREAPSRSTVYSAYTFILYGLGSALYLHTICTAYCLIPKTHHPVKHITKSNGIQEPDSVYTFILFNDTLPNLDVQLKLSLFLLNNNEAWRSSKSFSLHHTYVNTN